MFTDKSDVKFRYDVALVFLKQDAVLNEKVKLASLPNPNQECPSGNSLIISGWGSDWSNLSNPRPDIPILRAVKQGCLDITKCERLDPLRDKDIVLCVGDEEDLRSSTGPGDSGGMLFSKV